MKSIGLIVVAATLACVLALPAYSITSTVQRCTITAQHLLDNADPLDRNPPSRVVAAIEKWVGFERLSSILSVALLDRFSCSGEKLNSADWLLDRPALSWQLARIFDERALVALYASTADMQKGTIGFNAAARRLYFKNLDQLDEYGIACLLHRATGKSTHEPLLIDSVSGPPIILPPICPSEFHPPRRA